MKVYIVQASTGSYDDYAVYIHSVHTEEEKAVNEKNKLNEEYDLIKNTPCSFEVDERGFPVNEESMTKEQIMEYMKWWRNSRKSAEWNGADVMEYEIDKIYTEE